ncbi:hypothetical protein Dimus_021560 [Dionaea muscipula]
MLLFTHEQLVAPSTAGEGRSLAARAIAREGLLLAARVTATWRGGARKLHWSCPGIGRSYCMDAPRQLAAPPSSVNDSNESAARIGAHVRRRLAVSHACRWLRAVLTMCREPLHALVGVRPLFTMHSHARQLLLELPNGSSSTVAIVKLS